MKQSQDVVMNQPVSPGFAISPRRPAAWLVRYSSEILVDEIDVFISHATGDRQVADTVCQYLERHGMQCWIAPRDIGTAMSWLGGAAIDQAVQRSRLVLLAFTKRADRSVEASHELTRAAGKQVQVLAIRVCPGVIVVAIAG